jgi:6,7-dimethyl-8-ribityllumazine synthase
MKEIVGQMIAKGKQFGIVISRFNELVSKEMLSGAVDTLMRHGVKENEIVTAWTPGAFEIPLIAGKMAHSKKYDAIICLGAVIRGDTPHFDYISAEATKGVAQVGMQSGIPVVFGILTVDTLEQAFERAGSKAGNKGRHAAETAIEMVSLVEQM